MEVQLEWHCNNQVLIKQAMKQVIAWKNGRRHHEADAANEDGRNKKMLFLRYDHGEFAVQSDSDLVP